MASPDAKDGSLLIHQDAHVYLSLWMAIKKLRHDLRPGRHAWLQVLLGSVELNDRLLQTSDGAAVSGETKLSILAKNLRKLCCSIWPEN